MFGRLKRPKSLDISEITEAKIGQISELNTEEVDRLLAVAHYVFVNVCNDINKESANRWLRHLSKRDLSRTVEEKKVLLEKAVELVNSSLPVRAMCFFFRDD